MGTGSLLQRLHTTKMYHFRSYEHDQEDEWEGYSDQEEEKEEEEEEWSASLCSCVWSGYRVVQTCASCISLGYPPICECEWRGLRDRSYRTHCCLQCQDPTIIHTFYKQILVVRKKLNAVAAAGALTKKRLNCIHRLFSYLAAEAVFVRSSAKFQATMVAKAKEFRADDRAVPIFPILDQVIAVFDKF